jgi:hypothetical protein
MLEVLVLRNLVQTMEARPKFDMGLSKLKKLYVQGSYNVKPVRASRWNHFQHANLRICRNLDPHRMWAHPHSLVTGLSKAGNDSSLQSVTDCDRLRPIAMHGEISSQRNH